MQFIKNYMAYGLNFYKLQKSSSKIHRITHKKYTLTPLPS